MTTGKRGHKFVGRIGSSLRSKERPKNDVRKRLLREGNLLQPIRSTTQIWVATRHQYGISAVISQTSFPGGASGGVVNPDAYVFQTFRACLHGGGGPQVGKVTCLGGVKKISLLYKQSYNPAIPGCAFSRLLNGREAGKQEKCWQTMCFADKCTSTLTCCSCCNLQCNGFLLLTLIMMQSHHQSEVCESLMYHESDPGQAGYLTLKRLHGKI